MKVVILRNRDWRDVEIDIRKGKQDVAIDIFTQTASIMSGVANTCWILTRNETATMTDLALWHADCSREKGTGFTFPNDTQTLAVKDGVGGVWILCSSKGENNLWHVTRTSERSRYFYPLDMSVLASDGQGGVWILTHVEGKTERALYHVNEAREKQCYCDFPADSNMVGDGSGGAWVLCNTKGTIFYGLWHVTLSAEKQCHDVPRCSKMVGDGQGGLFLLCNKTGDVKLWHVTESHMRELTEFPAASKMVCDGLGNAWILCDTKDKGHRLWRVDKHGVERDTYEYPSDAKLVSGKNGDVWILCHTKGHNDFWRLWGVNGTREANLYDYPSDSILIDDHAGNKFIDPPESGTYKTAVENKSTKCTTIQHNFAQGAHRIVHKCKYTAGDRKGQLAVCKVFKKGAVFEQKYFQEDIRAVDKAIEIACAFNLWLHENRDGTSGVGKIFVNRADVWEFTETKENNLTEPFIANYEKFNSNSGAADNKHALMQALSHFSYHYEGHRMPALRFARWEQDYTLSGADYTLSDPGGRDDIS